MTVSPEQHDHDHHDHEDHDHHDYHDHDYHDHEHHDHEHHDHEHHDHEHHDHEHHDHEHHDHEGHGHEGHDHDHHDHGGHDHDHHDHEHHDHEGHGHEGHDHDHHDHGGHGHGSGATWDERYATGEWPTEPDPLLVELTGPLSPGRAIDLGCGTGRNAVWLATAGWKVTGVDGSSVGLAQAGERAESLGTSLDTLQADLAEYRPDTGAYDLVVVANIHLPAEERDHLFAAAAEALTPGGHLYIVGHHLESLGLAGPPDPDRLYTEELLGEAFAGLDVVRLGRTGHGDTAERSTAGDVYLWAVRPA